MPITFIEEQKELKRYLKKVPTRYRDGNLLLAYYASFPGVFTPNMLYQFLSNFSTFEVEEEIFQIHYIAVSDLLLSAFCTEISHELFEMDEGMQNFLQSAPTEFFENYKFLPSKKEIAAFTYKYANKFFNHPYRKTLRDVLYWKALTFLSPDYAGSKIAQALQQYSKDKIPTIDEIQLILQITDLREELIKEELMEVEYSKFPSLSDSEDNESVYSKKINHPALRKKIFNSFSSFNIEVKEKLWASEKLENLVGLKSVKKQIEEHLALNNAIKQKSELRKNKPLHLVFKGNQGTGKTTVARLLAEIYQERGILERGHLIEVSRSDLVAVYVGQTAIKTQRVCAEAMGGVLFIDEAYSLIQDNNDTFGKEATNTLLKIMEDRRDDLCVIFAGNPSEIEKFLDSNPGLRHRIGATIDFEDYNPEELFRIFELHLNKINLFLTEELKVAVRNILKNIYDRRDKNFGNAREVEKLKQGLVEKHALRIEEKKLNIKFSPIEIIDIPDHLVEMAAIVDLEQKIKEIIVELNKMTGLRSVKNLIKEIVSSIKVDKIRASKEINIGEKKGNIHLVFSGNPGTGKTRVARILGRIFKALDVVKKGHVVEAQRADLVAGYIGQTALKTKKVFESALDGILFIDEPYTLTKGGRENNFGQEAAETILKMMEDFKDRIVVIAAGYPEEMTQFIERNPGFKSRFTNTFLFEDYTEEELWKIFQSLLKQENYFLAPEVEESVKAYFYNLIIRSKERDFENGREVRKLFSIAKENLERRTFSNEESHAISFRTILSEDIPKLKIKRDAVLTDFDLAISLSPNVKKAEEIFCEMKDEGIKPSSETFNLLISKSRSFKKAEEFFYRMQDEGVKPNTETFNVLIDKSRSLKKTEELFYRMQDEGVKPSADTFNVLIGKSTSFKKAEELLHRMQEEGVKPSAETFKVLIGKSTSFKKAEELFYWMQDEGVRPSAETFNVLIGKSRSFKKAEELLYRMQDEGVRPSAKTFNVLIGKSTSFKKAEELFYRMQDERVKPNAETFNVLIGKSTSFKKAEELFYRMLDEGVRPSAETFNLLIGKSRSLNEAEEFFYRMLDEEVKPSAETFNMLIGKSTSFKKAEEIFRQMTDVGIKPNGQTFGLLLNKSHSFLAMGGLTHLATNMDLNLNVEFFNSFLNTFPYFKTTNEKMKVKLAGLLSDANSGDLERTEKSFYQLNKLKSNIPTRIYSGLHSMLRNISIVHYNNGNRSLESIIFNMYRQAVDGKTIFYESKISGRIVNNITSFALRGNQIEWLETFLNRIENSILEEIDQSFILALNRAKLLFFKGSYEKALNTLQYNTNDVHLKINCRLLEVMTHYELKSEMVNFKMEAFKIFIYRVPLSRISTKFKEGNNNFIDILKMISHPKTVYDSQRVQKIRSKILNLDLLAEKNWLLEKIYEMDNQNK